MLPTAWVSENAPTFRRLGEQGQEVFKLQLQATNALSPRRSISATFCGMSRYEDNVASDSFG